MNGLEAAEPSKVRNYEYWDMAAPVTFDRGWVLLRYNLGCEVTMAGKRRFTVGDCVRIPDGRIGRVRAVESGRYRVRVQRHTSKTHQFLLLGASELSRVACPAGWMSPDGYRRYLEPTLAKMRARQRAARKRRR